MPLLAWLMLTSRSDLPARIWFSGMGFYAAGGFLLSAQKWLDGWTSLVAGPCVAFVMVLCMYEALRRDLRAGPVPWLRLLISWLMFVASAITSHAMDVRTTWGQVYASVFWLVADAVILAQSIQLVRQRGSRGALVIALAMLLGISSHVMRALHVWGTGGSMHLLDLQPVTNYFYLVNIIGVTLCSFGYWGYVLEKSQRNEILLQTQAFEAQTEARLALSHAEEMRSLIQQRDQMLMLNSRFAAINSLAIFNSAVIHEVSQPVQSISLCIEKAQLLTKQAGLTDVVPALDDARHQVGKLASLLMVMRRLVSTQSDDLEPVRLSQVKHEILPVLRSEVTRRGVVWEENLEFDEMTVMANKVLLERLLLNLVGNALDAVGEQIARREAAQICLSIRKEHGTGVPRLQMVVQDNGPGVGEGFLLNTEPFQSTKKGGLGVGLAFARLIVRQWGGELTISNLDGEQRGVRATLSLPVTS